MNWTVEPITKKQAALIVTSRHYSHRASFFSCAFALVIDGLIEGVVVYGNPSRSIQQYAFGDFDGRIYELTRLVIQTSRPNAASFLVATSLKMLPYQPSAVVSYADTEMGHSGIVYQATNWLYTGALGETCSPTALFVDGVWTHPRTLARKGLKNPVAWARENDVPIRFRSVKHRYFYLNGNKYQRRDMLAKLKYPVVGQYPKSEKTMYDAGEHIVMHANDAMADGFGGLA